MTETRLTGPSPLLLAPKPSASAPHDGGDRDGFRRELDSAARSEEARNERPTPTRKTAVENDAPKAEEESQVDSSGVSNEGADADASGEHAATDAVQENNSASSTGDETAIDEESSEDATGAELLLSGEATEEEIAAAEDAANLLKKNALAEEDTLSSLSEGLEGDASPDDSTQNSGDDTSLEAQERRAADQTALAQAGKAQANDAATVAAQASAPTPARSELTQDASTGQSKSDPLAATNATAPPPAETDADRGGEGEGDRRGAALAQSATETDSTALAIEPVAFEEALADAEAAASDKAPSTSGPRESAAPAPGAAAAPAPVSGAADAPAPAPAAAENGGPTVDSARFVTRVTRAFEAAQQRGGGPIEIRLSPPELGALQIKLEVREGILTASLETETQAARNALLDNLPALRERLAEQQIRIEKFDVDVREDDSANNGASRDGGRQSSDGFSSQDRGNDGRGGGRRASAIARAAEPAAITDTPRLAPTLGMTGDERINLVA
ncbi:Flagellar hook-length control protein FliK [Pseudobythopirellula maris]|uniref:Flagellar hook-length control protein FliK n=1 Tax=Pseudobythopirellula maris TaxID=2527991 RepID=A0A5C5ZHP9_9BACT|nr:flagellar hook-length control protein FliK [Pseudobythopirellula maris]TWT86517.1 Flagellar hook-length control protein FliK [Pseudobythopirellula maris]